MNTAENTERDIIGSARTGHVHQNSIDRCNFVWATVDDGIGFEGTRGRTKIEVRYIPSANDIRTIVIKKFVGREEPTEIRLDSIAADGILAFLRFAATTNLGTFSGDAIPIPLIPDEFSSLARTMIQRLIEGAGDDGENFVIQLLADGAVANKDITNVFYRKESLRWFQNMLEDIDAYREYAATKGISDQQEEKVWQHFFEQNPWIFGYGLDYRYQNILQREFRAGTQTLAGIGDVIGDFLMGDRRFTTFVELKKPTTSIVGTSVNRNGAWKLSNDLLDAFSQILEQKAAGELRYQQRDSWLDSAQNEITQMPIDSKVILVIGNWASLTGTQLEKKWKRQTFERFRRDSRNVEIITYDELFDRAQFIVEGA